VGLYDPGSSASATRSRTGSPLTFDAVPRFSPEHFGRIQLLDPMKRKQLQKGITSWPRRAPCSSSSSRAARRTPICGVVGQLQFEVLTFRLQHEYGAKIVFDRLPFGYARWVEGAAVCEELDKRRIPMAVTDIDGHPVALLRDQWELDRIERDNESGSPRDRPHETAPIAAPRSIASSRVVA
jgi:peptide chain release factor 3